MRRVVQYSATGEVTEIPDLITGRFNHACSNFINNEGVEVREGGSNVCRPEAKNDIHNTHIREDIWYGNEYGHFEDYHYLDPACHWRGDVLEGRVSLFH